MREERLNIQLFLHQILSHKNWEKSQNLLKQTFKSYACCVHYFQMESQHHAQKILENVQWKNFKEY